MCGIVGYIGTEQCEPLLLKGLERLEYRGYDSAGVAILNDGMLQICKAKGRLGMLRQRLTENPVKGTVGIAHTRWATHGEPSDVNSHPQVDTNNGIAVVHNGIIENYLKLKNALIEKGYEFVSQTDTEVIVHLLNYCRKGTTLETIYKVLSLLEGSFALGILFKDEPDKIYCTRKDSPLVVGISVHGNFIASDVPAFLEHSRDVFFMDDNEVAVLTTKTVEFYDALGTKVEKDSTHIDWDIAAAEKTGFEHFMIKEIHEQPTVMREMLNYYVDLANQEIKQERMPLTKQDVEQISRITIIACGTASHAGFVGKAIIESLARIPVAVDIASEYRYRNPLVLQNELVIVISQSGETADTIAAMRSAKANGARIIAICNVVGSTISREADCVLYTLAGPEIAVASTKAYSTQLLMLYILALDIAVKRGNLGASDLSAKIDSLSEIPVKAQEILNDKERIQQFASEVYDSKSVFFIGRGLDNALAMEAALKLKEVSYIHSEAYPAGELKHGTIALIEKGTLVVAIATQRKLLEKTASNVKEVSVRGAQVLTIALAGVDSDIEQESDDVWHIPAVDDFFSPLLSIIPLQLFAYYMALNRGCDIDKPRNLAKSVTVE